MSAASRERLSRFGGLVVDTPILQALAVGVIFVIGIVTLPGFAGGNAVKSMLVLAAFLGVASVGQTLVVLLAGIDLSVPALIGAGNVIATQLYGKEHMPFFLVAVIVIAFGVFVGACSGFISNRFEVTPLIVTLAVGAVVGGGVLLWTHGTLTGSAPEWLGTFTSPASSFWFLPVPGVVVFWLVLAVAVEVFLRRSVLGRRIYATGASDTVATLSGVNVRRVRLLTYMLSGAAATFGGVVLSGYVGSTYIDIGAPYLFASIAAVIVGGASILGGRGTYWGTVAGALTLTVLSAMLPLFHLDTADLEIVYGIVILVGVALSRLGAGALQMSRRGGGDPEQSDPEVVDVA